MIDITAYQQRLEWLKEWMNLRIDRMMREQVVIYERVGRHSITHDFRNFYTFCRHKTRSYKNGALRSFFK